MGLGVRLVNHIFNLRVLQGVILICIACGLTPLWFTQTAERLDTAILRFSVDYIDLPPPETSATVIHVPDIEYEAWLSDFAGTQALAELISKSSDATTFGFIADEPIDFIQGSSDKLLSHWQAQGSIKPKGFSQGIAANLKSRQQLLEALEKKVVVGVPLRGSELGGALSMHKLEVNSYFADMVHLVWRMPPSSSQFDVGSVVVEHFPAPADFALEQYLVLNNTGQLRESFTMSLLKHAWGGADIEVQWLQREGMRLGDHDLPLSYTGGVIPLYGEHTGLEASATQLTLAAAKRMESLDGWVLIGRDESQPLAATAQTLLAVSDKAFLVSPFYYPLLKLALLCVLLVLGVWLLLHLKWRVFCVVVASVLVALLATQIAFAALLKLWLPMAELILASAAVAVLSLLWRIKRIESKQLRIEGEHWALQAARLYYLEGKYLEAKQAMSRAAVTPLAIRWYYRIAKTLEEQGYPDQALEMWVALPRRYYRFSDISERIRNCNKLVAPEVIKAPSSVEQTQVVCVPNALEKLGRYEVRQVLGHGGSGVVYQGYDPVIGRDVALKTLNLNVFASTTRGRVKERFLSEVKTVGKLSHPNIVAVYDVGEQANWAYIAMDLAKGKPLTEYVDQGKLLPVADVYWVGLKVAEALAFAHQQNIVHCDIKPGNILYDRDTSEVKVTDFGIAKWLDEAHTETGEIMGSPLYMAPEQLQGRSIVEQTDIFSLGATLYQLLTAKPPFNGRSIAEIQQSVLHAQPEAVRSVRDDLPASAARIVNRALKKRTTERFSSTADMAFTLNKAIIRDFKDEAKAWRLL